MLIGVSVNTKKLKDLSPSYPSIAVSDECVEGIPSH